jgi:hypothetical protein
MLHKKILEIPLTGFEDDFNLCLFDQYYSILISKAALAAHLFESHGAEDLDDNDSEMSVSDDEDICACEYCDDIFITRTGLAAHVEEMHEGVD